MTKRDRETILELYYIHRLIPASIAKLFGVDHATILYTVHKNKDISIRSDTECLICGLEDCQTFYIDGKVSNKSSQNVIMLCEADKRRLRAMQLRKRKGSLRLQLEN